ncbi:MAG TPA: SDR family NAD(P)-dependent oxidoreductase [Candidatus Tectomicrobia bacterium]|nr:SDR family NAD(P)-dependent oxidoreductase [Candidatus Tectomicrobia bacterium]
MPRFPQHVVLVTGASSGIGAALAVEFARDGADLALVARRVDRLRGVASEVERLGRRALALPGDVTVDGDMERAVAAVRERFGRLDVVVANAGFGVVGPVARLTLDDYRRQFETNVFGVLRTIHATLPDLERSRGRLAIVGSVSGHVATPGSSPYAMSKFAVRALAEALGHELAPAGVSVTLVSPGFVDSEIRRVDNLGRFQETVRDPVPRWLIMPTAKAARQIVRAIARRRREVVISGHGKVIVALQRHAPWLLARAIRTFGVRSRPEPGR